LDPATGSAAVTTVRAKHFPYEDGHLGQVVADMKLHGAPTLRVVKFQGDLYALEGSHRLAAAAYLGVIPKVVIEQTEVNSLPDGHWEKVGGGLPEYEFGHVLALDLAEFAKR
jgi:hypothetical protein